MADTSIQTPAIDKGNRNGALPVYWLVGILVVVVIYFVSQMLGVIIINYIPALHALKADSTAGQFWYVVIVESLTLGMLFWFLRHNKLRLTQLGLLRPRLRDFGMTLLAYPPYFILNAIATIGATLLFHLNTKQQQQTGFEAAKSASELALTFVSLVLLPPLVEEIVMRGFLFGSLKSRLPVVKAALVTSVLFAVAHLQFGSGAPLLWVAAIDTFILSLVLCYLRQKTGSLWAGIGLHCLKNLLAFLVLFIFPKYHLFQEWGSLLRPWTSWLW